MRKNLFPMFLKSTFIVSIFCLGVTLIVGSGGPPPMPVSLNLEQISAEQARSVFIETLIDSLKYNSYNSVVPGTLDSKKEHFDRFSEGNYKFIGTQNTTDEKTFIFLFASEKRKNFYAVTIDFFGGDPQIIAMSAESSTGTIYYLDIKNLYVCSSFILKGEPKVSGNSVELFWDYNPREAGDRYTEDVLCTTGYINVTMRRYLLKKYTDPHRKYTRGGPTQISFEFVDKQKLENFVSIFNSAFPGRITVH